MKKLKQLPLEMSEIKKLNHEQQKAVTYSKGPLLIVAGAGTGKTTVITQRIARLINKGKAKPEEILGVTFTEKAAEEMEKRVDEALPIGYLELWISTFHSFAERVLRDHALDTGLPNDFKIIDETSAWLLVRQNLARFKLHYYKPRGNPSGFIHALINHFSRCKDQGIYPEDYLEYSGSLKTNLTDLPEDLETERTKEVAEAYHAYQGLLLENSFFDFGDLINYCLNLFRQRRNVLEKYRDKFHYILVDEFQDTNWSQYELVKILSAPNNNLTVCADDDQAIYRWRGASFNNIIQFKKDFPDTKEVFLVKNYRSLQNILDLSYDFIQANNPDRLEYVSKLDKKLISQKEGRGMISHLHFADLYQEAQGVINKIISIMKEDKQARYSDFAVLVRANSHAKLFTQSMERTNIPYQFLASQGLYAKPVILDILSYFNLLDNYHESSAVYRVLNLPFLDISSEDIVKINQYCLKKTKSLFDALSEISLISGLPEETVLKVNLLLSWIKKHTKIARERNVTEVLSAFLEDTHYEKYLKDHDKREEISFINQFDKRIKAFEESSQDPLLRNFMEQMKMELESGEQGKLEFDIEKGPDMVNVMTIHAAKGLEFKYVFVVNMVDKRFPSIKRKELIEIPRELIKDVVPQGDVHLQEERRLFYVAMTRAKRGLFFTSADDYGGVRSKKISLFLSELGFDKKREEPATKKMTPIGQKKDKRKYDVRGDVLPHHFSFSQLAAFQKCPLQYKFAHIIKIRVKGKAVFSFGKTIHNTLYDFVRRCLMSKPSLQKGLFVKEYPEKEKNKINLPDIKKIYEKNWIDSWYESKAQKKEYYLLGKKIIKDFYEDFSSYPPRILRINGRLGLELPFAIKIGGDTIKGVIDRIDDTQEGIEVIDYKTGSFKDRLSSSDKMQLLIYHIALEQAANIVPAKLSYYYLEENKRTSFTATEKEKEEAKEKIIDEINQIKKSDFSPTPGWQCKFCDFKGICDYAQL